MLCKADRLMTSCDRVVVRQTTLSNRKKATSRCQTQGMKRAYKAVPAKDLCRALREVWFARVDDLQS
eukprot:COSAG05_NODE_265_length_12666_cov_104.645739_2_plen_67_part_00